MTRRLETILGVALGLAGFYGTSVASAFWISRPTESVYVWALLLSSLLCLGFGILVTWRVTVCFVAGLVLIALAIISFGFGGDSYIWVAPFPLDVPSIFFHGGRSPLVIGVSVLVGTAGIARAIMSKRRENPTAASPSKPSVRLMK
jgi:hypothetical protein